MDKAEELIKWFNNHTRALAALKEMQQALSPTKPVLTLLYPVSTRWSSRFQACARFVELRVAFECLISAKLEQLVSFTPKGRNVEETARKESETREMLLVLRSAEFWHGLIECVQIS